ncbi:hypothetical protein LIN78_13480 [Leeia sp. TBRC 13508]|uniref:Tetracyclin repressor-like C-terminal domain-containing protein n=1 Tax=Leeia speluncae TaxID=2884804 RepID=A0ABS8D8N0_9NEIS|nr:hypothetical protein [Leeia speluncae]MCB6184554.1 hypothetical protein [Leeia speluncae]
MARNHRRDDCYLKRSFTNSIRKICQISDAAPLYNKSPEVDEIMAESDITFNLFIEEVLPKVSKPKQQIAAHLVMSACTAAGKDISELKLSNPELNDHIAELTEMLVGYLVSLNQRGG